MDYATVPIVLQHNTVIGVCHDEPQATGATAGWSESGWTDGHDRAESGYSCRKPGEHGMEFIQNIRQYGSQSQQSNGCRSWASHETCILPAHNNLFSFPNRLDVLIWLWTPDQPADGRSAAQKQRMNKNALHNTWSQPRNQILLRNNVLSRVELLTSKPASLLYQLNRRGAAVSHKTLYTQLTFRSREPKFYQDFLQAISKFVTEATTDASLFTEFMTLFYFIFLLKFITILTSCCFLLCCFGNVPRVDDVNHMPNIQLVNS